MHDFYELNNTVWHWLCRVCHALCAQYKSVVKPLKVEYRTAKHDWMALKNESGSLHRTGTSATNSTGGGFSGVHDSGDKVDIRNAELQWRAVSPKLFKAAKDLLEDFAPKVRSLTRA